MRLATGVGRFHSGCMSSTRLDEILLFALPVVVIVIGLLWNIGRSIDRVARNLERLAEAQEQSAARPKE